jgi:(p)ppGpp synthase/HD superfamily hydrolase
MTILSAASFANECHRGQFRKYNGSPYILHPMRVAGRVTLRRNVSEQLVSAAWLHDVIEDCGVTENDLWARFGPKVTSRVMELTNPSKGSKLPRAERKRMDREHIAAASHGARVIKLLDRIDNLQEMQGCGDDFLALYRKESLLLLEALAGTDEELEDELGKLCAERKEST